MDFVPSGQTIVLAAPSGGIRLGCLLLPGEGIRRLLGGPEGGDP
jgi:hypothetical protein